MDIFAGDGKVFTEVKAGTIVPYREVSRGLTTFRARTAGHETERPLAENMEILRAGKFSTVVLMPGSEGKNVDITVLKDYVWPPTEGKAKVRVVHTIPSLTDIDVFSRGKKLLGGVDFQDESRYVEVDPLTGDL